MTTWTDKMKRELADVQILPLEQLRALPAEFGDYDGGIYFLWLGEELQYIGKSRQLCNRLNYHKVKFDRCTLLLIVSDERIHDFSKDPEMQRLERAYIAHYQPPHNCLHQNPGT